MKKILCALLALGMVFSVTFAAACGGKGGDGRTNSSDCLGIVSSSSESDESVAGSEESSEEDDWEEFIPDYTSPEELTEYFAGKVGTVTYNTGKHLEVQSLAIDAPIYLGNYSEHNVFTVDGGEGFGKTLTVLGDGGGVVQSNGGILVLKNLTIQNNTHGFGSNYYRDHYAEFGGKVRFENCVIACSIQLRNDAEAEFIDCEIQSTATDMYGVWVADGSAKFDGCTFTGYRGLKVHEIGGMDVLSVTVENCIFDNLTTKPAIAIDFEEPVSFGTITFKYCEILNCAPYKKTVEGIDGFYESVTPTENYTFTATECWLDVIPFDFIDGEFIELDI